MTLTARLVSANTAPAEAACRFYNDMALIAVETMEISKDARATRCIKAGAVSLQDALKSAEDNFPAEMFNLGEMFGEESPLTVITNRDSFYGAVGILFPSVQNRLRALYGDRFVILPSSVHEVIAAPMEIYDDNLSGMVKAINAAEVEGGERLSDSAFLAEFTPAGKMTLTAI